MAGSHLEAAQNIAPVIGQLTLLFSMAEFALDECVIEIYKSHSDAAKRFDKEFPRSLSRKIKFLRRCFNQIEALSADKADKEDSLMILQQMVDLADHRNFLVHGAPTLADLGPHTLKMQRFSYDNSPPSIEDRVYTYRQVWDIYMSCSVICTNALFLAHFLKTNWIRRAAKSR